MAGKSLNKVLLIGNLGKDPELSYTASGIAVAKFSIATNERWKDAEGNVQERTEWHNIIAWRKLAEICGQYLKKGSKVYLEGKIQTRSWDDKNTGAKRYATEVIADDLIMLDAKGAPTDAGSGSPVAEESGAAAEKEDLPF
ncbi:MAG: single-stranded DNA-binding protein [Ignavibacteriae bacterium]|nr:single-stranded DNA-binding protein [Ignavibacteria bacterium]MBI3364154.1 single-stranded DNA-binding protein [Ignavibacteriota bacterium]